MRFTAKTLIDITETNARKIDDPFGYRQQQNWMTFIQTSSLRVNVYPVTSKNEIVTSLSNLGFGSNFRGKHRVWTVEFDIEYEGGLELTMLEEDFDLVPIIIDLNETAEINNSVFRTRDSKERNIVFELQKS